MEATTEPVTNALPYQYGVPKYAGHRMTKAEFLRWESDDNYVYEFNDGVLEPTTGMRQDENYLLTNLENQFFQTNSFKSGDRLRAEMDVWPAEKQMRRPDIAYFTADQLGLMAADSKVVPSFVVELGSGTDSEMKSLMKRHEYFDAGVQVVWWVYPLYKEVYVYTSPKTVTICTDDDVLSAAPALPELTMTVAELFKK